MEAVEKSYWAADIAVDEEMNKLVIQVDDSSDDHEPFSSSDDDDRNYKTVHMVCIMYVSSQ